MAHMRYILNLKKGVNYGRVETIKKYDMSKSGGLLNAMLAKVDEDVFFLT